MGRFRGSYGNFFDRLDIDKEIDNLKKDLDNKNDINDVIEKTKKFISDISSKIEDFNSDMEDLDYDKNELEDKVDDLEHEVEALESKSFISDNKKSTIRDNAYEKYMYWISKRYTIQELESKLGSWKDIVLY